MTIYKNTSKIYTIFHAGCKYLIEKNESLSVWEISEIQKQNAYWDTQGVWIGQISTKLIESEFLDEAQKIILFKK